jgi:hypothetical protein
MKLFIGIDIIFIDIDTFEKHLREPTCGHTVNSSLISFMLTLFLVHKSSIPGVVIDTVMKGVLGEPIHMSIVFMGLTVYNRSSLAFYWHSKMVSDPPLSSRWLTKRRT